eukprot:ANDGO_03751.mRNA.1 Myb-like protein M
MDPSSRPPLSLLINKLGNVSSRLFTPNVDHSANVQLVHHHHQQYHPLPQHLHQLHQHNSHHNPHADEVSFSESSHPLFPSAASLNGNAVLNQNVSQASASEDSGASAHSSVPISNVFPSTSGNSTGNDNSSSSSIGGGGGARHSHSNVNSSRNSSSSDHIMTANSSNNISINVDYAGGSNNGASQEVDLLCMDQSANLGSSSTALHHSIRSNGASNVSAAVMARMFVPFPQVTTVHFSSGNSIPVSFPNPLNADSSAAGTVSSSSSSSSSTPSAASSVSAISGLSPLNPISGQNSNNGSVNMTGNVTNVRGVAVSSSTAAVLNSSSGTRKRNRPTKGKWKFRWTFEDDQKLREAVTMYQDLPVTWRFIADIVGGGKTANSCYQRWNRTLGTQIRKGPFSTAELYALAKAVAQEGETWALVSLLVPGRTDTQCRMQWTNIKCGKIKSEYAAWLRRYVELHSPQEAVVSDMHSAASSSSEAGAHQHPGMSVEDAARAQLVKQIEEWVSEDPDRQLVTTTKKYELNPESLKMPDKTLVQLEFGEEVFRREWASGKRGLRHRVRGGEEFRPLATGFTSAAAASGSASASGSSSAFSSYASTVSAVAVASSSSSSSSSSTKSSAAAGSSSVSASGTMGSLSSPPSGQHPRSVGLHSHPQLHHHAAQSVQLLHHHHALHHVHHHEIQNTQQDSHIQLSTFIAQHDDPNDPTNGGGDDAVEPQPHHHHHDDDHHHQLHHHDDHHGHHHHQSMDHLDNDDDQDEEEDEEDDEEDDDDDDDEIDEEERHLREHDVVVEIGEEDDNVHVSVNADEHVPTVPSGHGMDLQHVSVLEHPHGMETGLSETQTMDLIKDDDDVQNDDDVREPASKRLRHSDLH